MGAAPFEGRPRALPRPRHRVRTRGGGGGRRGRRGPPPADADPRGLHLGPPHPPLPAPTELREKSPMFLSSRRGGAAPRGAGRAPGLCPACDKRHFLRESPESPTGQALCLVPVLLTTGKSRCPRRVARGPAGAAWVSRARDLGRGPGSRELVPRGAVHVLRSRRGASAEGTLATVLGTVPSYRSQVRDDTGILIRRGARGHPRKAAVPGL